MAYKMLLLTHARSRYDALVHIDDLTDQWAHGDTDYNFYWLPLERTGELTREQLIEASTIPSSELTEEMVKAANHIVAWDKHGKLIKYARNCPNFAPPISPLQTLLETYQPTWVGSMLLRIFDVQEEPRKPKNQYVYLHADEKLFVMHELAAKDPRFRYVVEECTIPTTGGGLVVRWVEDIESNEACNLTADGNSLLDGLRLAHEARLGGGCE